MVCTMTGDGRTAQEVFFLKGKLKRAKHILMYTRTVAFAVATLFVLILGGCIHQPYKPAVPEDIFGDGKSAPLAADEAQISRGEPYAFVDGLGHYLFSLPEKLVLWNWNMGNHAISPETEKALHDYLTANNLREVKVRLNEYSPGDEWSRLVTNEAVGAGWRYTVGTITVLFYTVLPGRLIGGDHYNPFTNTINIYSDLPSVALHEGGHAKDLALTEYKGSMAMLRLLPFVALFDEETATSDALSYLDAHSMLHNEKLAYKTLYPAFGTYIGGEAARWVPGGILLTAAGAIPGHIIGRSKASDIEAPEDKSVKDEIVELQVEAATAIPNAPEWCLR